MKLTVNSYANKIMDTNERKGLIKSPDVNSE